MRHCGARPEAEPEGDSLFGDQNRRRAIGHLARVAGGDAPANFGETRRHRRIIEGGLQRRELLDRRVAP